MTISSVTLNSPFQEQPFCSFIPHPHSPPSLDASVFLFVAKSLVLLLILTSVSVPSLQGIPSMAKTRATVVEYLCSYIF